MRVAIKVALSVAMGLVLFTASAFAQTTGFVYAMVNNNAAENTIYGFSLDTTTGALTPLPGFPVATGGMGSSGLTISEALVYDPAQSRLYATNVNNRVSMFDVDRATGAITALPFSPFFIQGALHGCMAVSPDGSILVGADLLSPFVDSLRIATSGVTPAPGSPFSTGSPSFSCAFRRDGGAVYTGGNIPFISGWTVSPSTGTLTPMPGSPFATPVIATGYATDTLNRLFTVSFTDGAVRAYSIEGGAPAILGSPTPSSQTGQIQGVMHPFGYYLATARNSNNVAVFRISGLGAGTTLTEVPGSPFATGGTFSNASIVDPSGQVVVTANGSSRNLTTFLFDSGTGAMTPAVLQPANTMGAAGGIVGLAFARKAGVTTPTPGPAPPPPTITSIPNQSMLQNSTISVPFTIGGSILTSALRVSITSSNTALLPVSPSALSTSCNSTGACTLRITPADGRAGSSTITLTVSDGTSATSTTFVVTVTAVRPSAPGVVLANALGSGFAVTWSPPDTGTPMAYAVSWGTNTTASNLPLQLVPGATPRFDVTAVPNGTYYFRIYAVGTGDLSPPSPLASVAVTAGASVPGPPLALRTTAGTNSVTSNWVAPNLGAAATIYEVHVGSGFGMNDVASATTASATHTASSLAAGSYWVRTRAASGGLAGAWSSSVQIPVASAPCTAAPGTPILLPVTTTPGQVTLTWIAMGGAAATFDAQIAFGAGLPPVGTLSTTGPGTSLVWNQMSGNFAARLVATNACGASARSNEVSFSVQ